MKRPILNRKHRALLNQRGMGIIEVIMAATLFGVVALGIASMIVSTNSAQGADSIKRMLATHKIFIENLVKDDKAWVLTIGHANNFAHMGCLRGNTACPDTTATGNNFLLATSDPDKPIFFDGTGLDSAFTGFDRSGKPCAYGPAFGNGINCPLKYSMKWYAVCSSGASCMNPQVRVEAIPQIDPSYREQLGLAVNLDNYKVDIVRGVGTRFDAIVLQELLPVSSNQGAGECSSPARTWKMRSINTEVEDDGRNVELVGGRIEFKAGTYSCRVFAPAFKVQSHKIRLVISNPYGTWSQGGDPPESTIIGAPMKDGVITVAALETVFSLNYDTLMQVEHWCENITMIAPGDSEVYGVGKTLTPPNNSFQFGYSSSTNYGRSAVFATLSCFRTG